MIEFKTKSYGNSNELFAEENGEIIGKIEYCDIDNLRVINSICPIDNHALFDGLIKVLLFNCDVIKTSVVTTKLEYKMLCETYGFTECNGVLKLKLEDFVKKCIG